MKKMFIISEEELNNLIETAVEERLNSRKATTITPHVTPYNPTRCGLSHGCGSTCGRVGGGCGSSFSYGCGWAYGCG